MDFKAISDITMSFINDVQNNIRVLAEPALDHIIEFYSSAESHDSAKCSLFHKQEDKWWDQKVSEIILKSEEKLLKGKIDFSVMPSEGRSETSTIKQSLDKVSDDILKLADLSPNAHLTIRREFSVFSSYLKKIPELICGKAVAVLWKPIRIISGDLGSYDKIYCFDEEMNVLFKLTPDDNYYHWGGYDLFPVGEELLTDSQKETLMQRNWHLDSQARGKYGFYDSSPELVHRFNAANITDYMNDHTDEAKQSKTLEIISDSVRQKDSDRPEDSTSSCNEKCELCRRYLLDQLNKRKLYYAYTPYHLNKFDESEKEDNAENPTARIISSSRKNDDISSMKGWKLIGFRIMQIGLILILTAGVFVNLISGSFLLSLLFMVLSVIYTVGFIDTLKK